MAGKGFARARAAIKTATPTTAWTMAWEWARQKRGGGLRRTASTAGTTARNTAGCGANGGEYCGEGGGGYIMGGGEYCGEGGGGYVKDGGKCCDEGCRTAARMMRRGLKIMPAYLQQAPSVYFAFAGSERGSRFDGLPKLCTSCISF